MIYCMIWCDSAAIILHHGCINFSHMSQQQIQDKYEKEKNLRIVEIEKKQIEGDEKEWKYERRPPSPSPWVILLQTCQKMEAQSALEAVDWLTLGFQLQHIFHSHSHPLCTIHLFLVLFNFFWKRAEAFPWNKPGQLVLSLLETQSGQWEGKQVEISERVQMAWKELTSNSPLWINFQVKSSRTDFKHFHVSLENRHLLLPKNQIVEMMAIVHNKEAMLKTLLVKCYGYMWRKGLTVTRLYFRIQYLHFKDVTWVQWRPKITCPTAFTNWKQICLPKSKQRLARRHRDKNSVQDPAGSVRQSAWRERQRLLAPRVNTTVTC